MNLKNLYGALMGISGYLITGTIMGTIGFGVLGIAIVVAIKCFKD